MGKIYDTIKETLDALEYTYHNDEDAFRMGVRGENTNMDVLLIADEQKELLMLSVGCPQKAVDRYMAELLQWMNHFNYWSVLGAFMVDDRDGEIVFRITLSLDEGAVNTSIISACLATAMATVDDSYPKIVKVLFPDDGDSATGDSDVPAKSLKLNS